MKREIPAVRILPMSDKIEGFRKLTIPEVQSRYFLDRLPARGGRFPYRASGLAASPGTLVLFQFHARIIASAVFIRDQKLQRSEGAHGGILHFQPDSFQVFDPV